MIFSNPQLPSIKDFMRNPVWVECEAGEYKPVSKLPVDSLDGCLVASELHLTNGDKYFGILGGIHLDDVVLTDLTINLIIVNHGKMFAYRKSVLEPYRSNYVKEFLCLEICDIFPILYDISEYARGNPQVLRGLINSSYPEGMSRDEQIRIISERHQRGK